MTAVLSRLTTALGCALLVSGCVLSTDAVIADDDLLLDDRLVGTWKEQDGTDSAVVTRDSGNVYSIAYSSEVGTGSFEGRLGRLGGRVVMDFSAAPRMDEIPDAYDNYLLPSHVLLTMDIGRDSVKIAALDSDSLRVALEAGRVRLGHGELRNRVILHATGTQLREAIGPWLGQPGSLTAQALWRKKTAAISSAGP